MSDGKIYSAISAIISDCPAISKNQKNQQQGFMYRGVDVVMNVFQPLLAKHRVFVVPELLDSFREERKTQKGGNLIYTVLRMRYTFYAEDGSSVSAVVQGEGMDSADKSSNKAMSVAFKYACFQVFCIPTEEFKDPDAEIPPPSVPQHSTHSDADPVGSFGDEPPAPGEPIIRKCMQCGRDIAAARTRSGKLYSAEEIARASMKTYHSELCWDCMKAEKEKRAKEAETHAGDC